MENDLVSVIIPIYNCEKYIDECVENILQQSYQQTEIILINDGSTDGSEIKCLELAERYRNIKYVYQVNSGAAVARNNGLEHASGNYIMFIDADDGIDECIIERLYNKLTNNIDIVCCSYTILESGARESFFTNDFIADDLKKKETFLLQLMDYTYGHNASSATAIGVPWAKLFRKSFLDHYCIKFNPLLRRMQDNVFVMEAIYYSKAICYIDEPLYRYRVEHNNSYKSYSYSPDIYLGVLHERYSFFSNHPELKTKTVKEFFVKERLNYLMMSIHFFVGETKGKKEAINEISNLCKDMIYLDLFQTKEKGKLSNKQKIQLTLAKNKMYDILYYIYSRR